MNQNAKNQIRSDINPPSNLPPRFHRELISLALIAFGYWFFVRLGLLLVAHPEGVASIWPVSGYALAVLLLNPKSQWTKLLAIIFVVNVAGNWAGGNPFLVSFGFALANVLEPFLGAWVLIRICKSKITFSHPLEIFILFGVAIIINSLTALLGAAVSVLAFDASFLRTWWLWDSADGLGIILITPLIVTWATAQNVFQPVSLRKLAESVFLVLVLIVFGWLLFGKFTVAENPVLRNYMIFPLLIWLAFRFDPRGMAGTLLLFAATAIWNTIQGYGIFGFTGQTLAERLALVQIFLMVISFSGLLLSTIIAERKRAESALQARLQLSQFADSHSLDELLQKTLDVTEILTGSKIGFFHFLEADQVTLNLQMWSTNTVQNMCTAEGKGQHYPIDQAGVWVDCVHRRAPVIHNNYYDLAHRKGLPNGHAPVNRFLAVPILREGLIVMIIGVGNKAIDYDQFDVKVVSELADSAWDIVQRKRAEESLRISEEKYRTVAEFTYDWESWRGPDNTYLYISPSCERITGHTAAEFVADSNLIIKITHPDDQLQVSEHFNMAYNESREQDLHLDFRIITPDGRLRWIGHFCTAAYGGDGRWLGRRESNRDITESKLAEEELHSAQAALTMINLELQTALAREIQLAHTDALTGINNRRQLYELAEREFEIAVRYQKPLSIIMFDIDHFKEVNDTFGHAAGDLILQSVTQAACAELRSTDVIGRYGGEEFVIVLPMTNAQHAYPLAERIRAGVAAIHLPTEKGEASATVSIGIVEKPLGGEFESVEDLIRHADKAMYSAKQAGRNRTVIGN